MSVTNALQKAVRARLVEDAAVSAIVSDRIFDGMRSEASYPAIEFGPSDASPYYDVNDCVQGYDVSLQVDCWVNDHGQLASCRALTDAVCASLRRAEMTLDAPHTLIEIRVNNRVFLDQDQIKAHGVVTIEAQIAQ